jgi:hypothetical protein
MRLIVSLVFLSALCLAAYSDEFYVASDGHDGGRGTKQEPWRTIRRGIGSLSPGDILFLRAGTYRERIIINSSGKPNRRIRIGAYPGETVTIDGSVISLPEWESGLVHIEDSHYISVTGLRITNAGPNDNNCGIYIDNSTNIIAEGNYTYNTTSSGIGIWGSRDIIVAHNEIELACNDGEQECITVAGTERFDVRDNHVHHGGPATKGGEGIDIKDGSRHGKIRRNVVHDLRGDRTGIYLDAWDKHTYDIEVYQNAVYRCGAGISMASEKGGLLESLRIFNNVVFANRSNGIEIGDWGEEGIGSRPVRKVLIINNTICRNGGGDWGGGVHIENPSARDIVIRNNITSENRLFQISNEASVRTTVQIDHNLIDGFRGYEQEVRGEAFVEADPQFVDPQINDFHLRSGSVAIDAGSPRDAPLRDFDGRHRPLGSGFEIGAFESH